MVILTARFADNADGDGPCKRICGSDQIRQFHVDAVETIDHKVHILHQAAFLKASYGNRPGSGLVHISCIKDLLVFVPDQGNIPALENRAVLHAGRGSKEALSRKAAVDQVIDLGSELFRHADLSGVLPVKQEVFLVLQEKEAKDHMTPVPGNHLFIRETCTLPDLADKGCGGKHRCADQTFVRGILYKGLFGRQGKAFRHKDQGMFRFTDLFHHAGDQCRSTGNKDFYGIIHKQSPKYGLHFFKDHICQS